AGAVSVTGNAMTTTAASPAAISLAGVFAEGGVALVASGNQVTGPIGDGVTPATYGFTNAAFAITFASVALQRVELTGNTETGAFRGIRVVASGAAGDEVVATDNVLSGTPTGVMLSWSSSVSA